jgi:cardiolipin synthase
MTQPPRDRVLTIPNVLSVIRLVLVPVFLYLLLATHAYALAVAILMFSGFSDWADGKIARLVANQSSRLGELLDPLVDRIYMLAVPLGLGLAGIVPWWLVATLIGRDAVLAATLPVVRSRGLTALPVTYIGKAATFALMSGFPLVLLGQWDATWSRVIGACGWGFVIWGVGMYLWSAVLYLLQVRLVVTTLPKAGVSDART